MTSSAFFELLTSLSVQVAIVIVAASWTAGRRKQEGEAHRVWAACHFFILLLVATAVLVPHLRLFSTSWITAVVEPSTTVSLKSSLGTDLLFLWFAGAAVGCLALLLGTLHAVRILRSSKPFHLHYPACSPAAPTPAFAFQMQNGKAIQLLASPRTVTAFCWQFHRPFIVLPDRMQAFPIEELQGVVRHEMAHLAAGHPLHLFLQRLVEILFWFHPLVWWASRQAAWSREFHCDALAVATAGEAASYLRGLLRMTEQRVGFGLGLPAGLAFASGVSLIQRRVDRLARRDWGVLPVCSSFATLVAPLVLCALMASSIWLPVNAGASRRAVWSPWPRWSAVALHELGMRARDYELDGHRLRPQEHLDKGPVL